MTAKTPKVNGQGLRIGQDHQNAKFTDGEVDLIRRLHNEGMSYPELAKKFGSSTAYISKLCRFEKRAQTLDAMRTLRRTRTD